MEKVNLLALFKLSDSQFEYGDAKLITNKFVSTDFVILLIELNR